MDCHPVTGFMIVISKYVYKSASLNTAMRKLFNINLNE